MGPRGHSTPAHLAPYRRDGTMPDRSLPPLHFAAQELLASRDTLLGSGALDAAKAAQALFADPSFKGAYQGVQAMLTSHAASALSNLHDAMATQWAPLK